MNSRPYQSESGQIQYEKWILRASTEFTLGDWVTVTESTSGSYVDPAVTADTHNVYGLLVAFVDKDGLAYKTRTSGFDGTYTEAATGDTYTPASDNLTDKKVAGIVIPAVGMIFEATLDAAKGTTAGSDKVGINFDILSTDSTLLDESSVSATKAMFLSVPGVASDNPTSPLNSDSTTKILVKVMELQRYHPV